MSLINQMLKDLDEQRAAKPKSVLADLIAVDTEPEERRRRLVMLGGLIGSVLAVALLFILLPQEKVSLPTKPNSAPLAPLAVETSPVVPAAAAQASSAQSPPVEVKPTPLPPLAKVKGLDIEMEEDIARLYIPVSQEVSYYLHSAKDHRHLVLTLQHTELGAKLPEFEDVNPPFEAINTEVDQHGNLLLKLDFSENTVVEALNFQAKPVPRIALEVKFQPEADVESAEPAQEGRQQAEHSEKKQPVKRQRPMTTEQLADRAFLQAQTFAEQGQEELATQLFQQSLALAPKSAKARVAYARFLVKQHQVAKAESLLAQGLSLMPKHYPFARLLAQIFLQQDQVKQALTTLLASAPEISHAPDYYALIAALYQRQGDYSAAAHLYYRLVKMRPRNGVWWMGLGIALESNGKPNAALQAFQRAVHGQELTPSLRAYINNRIHLSQ